MLGIVTIYWGTIAGFFLGFGFGVGCALAVMYSIFLGGYRAALRDGAMPTAPERLNNMRSRLKLPPVS
jgi:hypothetical protein